MNYWYLSKHGLGPGTIPSDCTVVDTKEHPTNRWKLYIALDRMLTTQELNYYDLKEEVPEALKETDPNGKLADSPYESLLEYYYVDDSEEFSDIDSDAAELARDAYGIDLVCCLTAKDEYADVLDYLGSVYVFRDGNRWMLGQLAGDRITSVSKRDIEEVVS